MARRRLVRAKGRKFSGQFLALPSVVLNCEDFKNLSGSATKLLIMLGEQYRGHNNGDLSAPFSKARLWGIRSQQTLAKALKELLSARLIVKTREGYFLNPGRKCALYALTWHPIDECGGKLDVLATTTAPRQFSLERAAAKSLLQNL